MKVSQPQTKGFLSQILSKFSKPEVSSPNTNNVERPWIGSLFGIPLPDDRKIETQFTPTIEAEIHILLHDLSTVKYKLQNDWKPSRNDKYHFPEMEHLICNVAWEYENAIALAWYVTSIDKVTGVRKEVKISGATRAVRVGKLKWCYVFYDGVKGPRFTPSPVEKREDWKNSMNS